MKRITGQAAKAAALVSCLTIFLGMGAQSEAASQKLSLSQSGCDANTPEDIEAGFYREGFPLSQFEDCTFSSTLKPAKPTQKIQLQLRNPWSNKWVSGVYLKPGTKPIAFKQTQTDKEFSLTCDTLGFRNSGEDDTISTTDYRLVVLSSTGKILLKSNTLSVTWDFSSDPDDCTDPGPTLKPMTLKIIAPSKARWGATYSIVVYTYPTVKGALCTLSDLSMKTGTSARTVSGRVEFEWANSPAGLFTKERVFTVECGSGKYQSEEYDFRITFR